MNDTNVSTVGMVDSRLDPIQCDENTKASLVLHKDERGIVAKNYVLCEFNSPPYSAVVSYIAVVSFRATIPLSSLWSTNDAFVFSSH